MPIFFRISFAIVQVSLLACLIIESSIIRLDSRARPSKALLHPFLKCELPLQLCLNEAPLYNETNWGDDRFSIDRSKCATLLRRNDSDEAVTEQMILQNSRGEIELKSSGIAARTYAERDKTSVGETNGLIEPKKRKLSTEDDAVVLLELGAEGTTKTGVAEKAESSESEDVKQRFSIS